ncbi:DUF6415 family natural product biosynthesis protein [Streptomyces sp. SS8]
MTLRVPASPAASRPVTDAIDRAMAAGCVPPRYEGLQALEAELQHHLQVLQPAAPAGSSRAAAAAAQSRKGLGEGLRSAVDQVRLLALDCRWPLRHLDHEGRPAR